MESPQISSRNRSLKPSIRLRQSSDSSKSNSTPLPLPQFPPPHVVLHPDDAASKIFLAVGRCLTSVDNKAMTIKDLSEMSMTMGYSCQNVSAASQAITTFIRIHLQRCETQLDSPLLLKHVLSGTPADDDLLPALYSTSGGASSTSSEPRLTNFRRGTVVWYLSRATGAPCPFARAGIRLCDYVDTGASQLTYKKKKELVQCGQKRKRRSTRECVLKHLTPDSPPEVAYPSSPLSSAPYSDDDDSEESDRSSEDERPPPNKIKLTLKLPPLSRVRQGTASAQGDLTVNRRSPSVPYSVYSAASSPPNSDDEDDDDEEYNSDDEGDVEDSDYLKSPTAKYFGTSMDVDDLDSPVRPGLSREVYDDDNGSQFSDEWDDEDDEELSTTWESPGPRSPSAQPPPPLGVKAEHQDVQGLLDQWEYDLDTKDHFVKLEEPLHSAWDWDWDSGHSNPNDSSAAPSNNSSSSSPIQPRIKQEDDLDLSLSLSGPAFTDWRHAATLSPTTPFGFSFTDEPDVFPSTPGAFPVPPTSPEVTYTMLRPRLWTDASPEPVPGSPSPSSDPTISFGLSSLIHSLSVNSPTASCSPPPLFRSQPLESRTGDLSEKEVPSPCVSPNDIRIGSDHELLNGPGSVVVNTCEPCVPRIVATHVEGIAVYQSSLGSHTLLRRIDTDFVNLTPILNYAQTSQPNAIPGATWVNKGKQEVKGLWVPVEAVRLYIKEYLKSASPTSLDSGEILDVFLSDTLVERFPTALREFVRTTRESIAKGTLVRQFGKHFGSDNVPTSHSPMAEPPDPTLMAAAAAKERVHVNDAVLYPSPDLSVSLVPSVEIPLSATEEEIFEECVNLEWETDVKTEEMEINEATRSAISPHHTPGRSNKSRPHAKLGSSSPPSSPLSSCPPSPVLHKTQLSTRAVSHSSPPSRASGTSTKSSGTLRRSKRVADALAAKSNVRTKSSKRGARNVS